MRCSRGLTRSVPTAIRHRTASQRNGSRAQLRAETVEPAVDPAADLARCFLRLANLPNFALDRLSRYEAILWRQVGQILFARRSSHWIAANHKIEKAVSVAVTAGHSRFATTTVVDIACINQAALVEKPSN